MFEDRLGLDTLIGLQIARKTIPASAAYNIWGSDAESKAEEHQNNVSLRGCVGLCREAAKSTAPPGHGLVVPTEFRTDNYRKTDERELVPTDSKGVRRAP